MSPVPRVFVRSSLTSISTSRCKQCLRVNCAASSQKGSSLVAGPRLEAACALEGVLTPEGEKAIMAPSFGMYSCMPQRYVNTWAQ